MDSGTKRDKELVRKSLLRFCNEGFIKRVGDKAGIYRRIEKECDDINFLEAPTDEINITLPLGLSDLAKTYRKNLIVFAGDPDAGKTALLLNIVKDNMYDHKILYFSSEMGDSELRQRLEKFPHMSLQNWKFEPKERCSNFADVIEPNAVNIIDYLEIHDTFYEVSGRLREIYEKLNEGIAIVALKKKPGQDMGRGGSFSLEKPRLYVAVNNEFPGHRLKVVKAKNWRGIDNPNGLSRKFKIAQGCILIPQTEWDK